MSWIKTTGGIAAAWALATLGACAGTEQLVGSDGSGATGTSGAAGGDNHSPTGLTTLLVGDAKAACLSAPLPEDSAGNPTCRVLRARSSGCDCLLPGLSAPSTEDFPQTSSTLKQLGVCGGSGQPACDAMCMCEVIPFSAGELETCRTQLAPLEESGWCSVSADQGDAALRLLETCEPNQRDEIRFGGGAAPIAGDIAMLICGGQVKAATNLQAELGEPCIGGDESAPGFSGYDAKEVNIHDDSSMCSTGVCVQNHFQGRASCPYGQAAGATDCLAEGSNEPVRYAVAPQLVSRQTATASICSCQCDGNGLGPYCTCPDSMQCEHLVDDLHLGQPNLAGSYCIPKGSEYDPNGDQTLCTEPTCGVAHPY